MEIENLKNVIDQLAQELAKEKRQRLWWAEEAQRLARELDQIAPRTAEHKREERQA